MSEILLELFQPFPCADIDPETLMPHATHAPLLHGFAQQGREWKFPGFAAGEQGMTVDPDTTESQPFTSCGRMLNTVMLKDEIPFGIV